MRGCSLCRRRAHHVSAGWPGRNRAEWQRCKCGSGTRPRGPEGARRTGKVVSASRAWPCDSRGGVARPRRRRVGGCDGAPDAACRIQVRNRTGQRLVLVAPLIGTAPRSGPCVGIRHRSRPDGRAVSRARAGSLDGLVGDLPVPLLHRCAPLGPHEPRLPGCILCCSVVHRCALRTRLLHPCPHRPSWWLGRFAPSPAQHVPAARTRACPPCEALRLTRRLHNARRAGRSG